MKITEDIITSFKTAAQYSAQMKKVNPVEKSSGAEFNATANPIFINKKKTQKDKPKNKKKTSKKKRFNSNGNHHIIA